MTLPDEKTMYRALLKKDSTFEGLFFVAVKTTGIFCRPTCSARKPKRKNIGFYPSAREALLAGFRPCKLCRPMETNGHTPSSIQKLLREVQADPQLKLSDSELRKKGIQPSFIRRWFKKHHGMTFLAYLRCLRMGSAWGKILLGEKVIDAAFDSGYDSLSGFSDAFKKKLGQPPSQSSATSVICLTRLATPLGPMLAGATEQGICLLEFADRRMLERQIQILKKCLQAQPLPGYSPHFDTLGRELDLYFKGRLQRFSVPLVLAGTPFQQKVWSALQTIPYSQTRSYQEQAKLLSNQAAVRAVARANGSNRLAILIPCHRVIGSNGKLVGYGGGLWRKKFLLNLEQKNK